jgi:hypothetical protein
MRTLYSLRRTAFGSLAEVKNPSPASGSQSLLLGERGDVSNTIVLWRLGTSEIGASAEGMHEAIQDIVKAMRDLTKVFS